MHPFGELLPASSFPMNYEMAICATARGGESDYIFTRILRGHEPAEPVVIDAYSAAKVRRSEEDEERVYDFAIEDRDT